MATDPAATPRTGEGIEETGTHVRDESPLEDVRHVAETRRAFWQLLHRYVPPEDVTLPERPRILNIGCATCEEALPLNSYFGNQPYGQTTEDVLIVGIDRHEPFIDRACQNYNWQFVQSDNGPVLDPQLQFQFITGDATQLEDLVEGTYDVVVSRHPHVHGEPVNWFHIFLSASQKTRPGGLYISTTYEAEESTAVEQMLDAVGYTVACTEENPYSLPGRYGRQDAYMLLAIKDDV